MQTGTELKALRETVRIVQRRIIEQIAYKLNLGYNQKQICKELNLTPAEVSRYFKKYILKSGKPASYEVRWSRVDKSYPE